MKHKFLLILPSPLHILSSILPFFAHNFILQLQKAFPQKKKKMKQTGWGEKGGNSNFNTI